MRKCTLPLAGRRLRPRLLDGVDGDDAGMIEGGEGLGFALESREAFGVVPERGRQDFQRDVAAELRVGGAIHLAHAACAELLQDLIVTSTRPVISESSRCASADLR